MKGKPGVKRAVSMRQKAGRLASLAIALGLILAIAGGRALPQATPAAAESPVDVQIGLNAPNEVTPDSDFAATVNISQVENFDATNYDVSFDPTVLRLDNVTSGELDGTVIPIDIWNETSPGRYTIVQNVPGLSGVSGSGYLAVLHFHTVAAGQSDMSLSNGVLSSNLAEEIPATWIGYSVNVISGEPGGQESPPAASPAEEETTEPEESTEPKETATEPPGETAGVSEVIDASGVFTIDVTTESADGRVKLTISKGTIGLTKEGKLLSEISIVKMAEPPAAPPPHSSIIGLTYDLGPDGATFDPPITLALTYVPGEIPVGVNEESLVLAFWDADAGEWAVLENGTVDPESNTITARINHFTAFTILAYIPSASPVLTIKDLVASPSEVGIGESVTISAMVSNSSGLDGSYEVTLKVDGMVEGTQTVQVAAGESKKVSFTVSRDVAENYVVSVGGLTAAFTVKVVPAPVPPTTSAQPKPINWPVLWGVIAVVVIVFGLIIFLQVRRRLHY